MVENSDALIPENGSWADYCDALQAERWLRRLEEGRLRRSQRRKAPAVSNGDLDAGGSRRHDGDEHFN